MLTKLGTISVTTTMQVVNINLKSNGIGSMHAGNVRLVLGTDGTRVSQYVSIPQYQPYNNTFSIILPVGEYPTAGHKIIHDLYIEHSTTLISGADIGGAGSYGAEFTAWICGAMINTKLVPEYSADADEFRIVTTASDYGLHAIHIKSSAVSIRCEPSMFGGLQLWGLDNADTVSIDADSPAFRVQLASDSQYCDLVDQLHDRALEYDYSGMMPANHFGIGIGMTGATDAYASKFFLARDVEGYPFSGSLDMTGITVAISGPREWAGLSKSSATREYKIELYQDIDFADDLLYYASEAREILPVANEARSTSDFPIGDGVLKWNPMSVNGTIMSKNVMGMITVRSYQGTSADIIQYIPADHAEILEFEAHASFSHWAGILPNGYYKYGITCGLQIKTNGFKLKNPYQNYQAQSEWFQADQTAEPPKSSLTVGLVSLVDHNFRIDGDLEIVNGYIAGAVGVYAFSTHTYRTDGEGDTIDFNDRVTYTNCKVLVQGNSGSIHWNTSNMNNKGGVVINDDCAVYCLNYMYKGAYKGSRTSMLGKFSGASSVSSSVITEAGIAWAKVGGLLKSYSNGTMGIIGAVTGTTYAGQQVLMSRISANTTIEIINQSTTDVALNPKWIGNIGFLCRYQCASSDGIPTLRDCLWEGTIKVPSDYNEPLSGLIGRINVGDSLTEDITLERCVNNSSVDLVDTGTTDVVIFNDTEWYTNLLAGETQANTDYLEFDNSVVINNGIDFTPDITGVTTIAQAAMATCVADFNYPRAIWTQAADGPKLRGINILESDVAQYKEGRFVR